MDPSTAGTNVPEMPGSDAAAAADAAAGGLRGFRRYTYWSIVAGAFVLLVLPLVTGPIPYPPHPLGTVALVAALTVVAAVMRLAGRLIPEDPEAPAAPEWQWRAWAGAGGAASVVVAATSVRAGDQILWLFGAAMIVSLLVAALPRRSWPTGVAAMIVAAVVAGIVVEVALGAAPPATLAISGAIVTAFVALLTLASVWTWDVAVQLDVARRRAATLAVANERLRFAAELHDVQGHHLQVIALKSELAGRLLREDPGAAERELAAVRELAADALRDTRAVVHGYRRATLDAEIANASNVLSSAGIDAQMHLDQDLRGDTLPGPSRHLLGLVLREAVTNILRHSAARKAEVRLRREGTVRLEVTNDGAEQSPPASAGGLHDLAARVAAAGGSLEWRREGEEFEVSAELPAGDGS